MAVTPTTPAHHALAIDPLGAPMLERHVQPLTELRMLVEQTLDAHRRLRRPIRAGRIASTTVNHRWVLWGWIHSSTSNGVSS